jgi:hypothetical protein
VATLHDLTPEEVEVAQTPIATIPFDQVGTQRSTSATVIIPKSAQWRRIRRDWGEPDFVVAAVSSERVLWAYCLADLGMRIEVDRQGRPIPVEVSAPGYGYSTNCERSSLRFGAAPGDELQVLISRSGQRPLPAGKLIVVGKWFYENDKIVGDELDAWLRPFLAGASILGLSLVALAAYFHRQQVVGD